MDDFKYKYAFELLLLPDFFNMSLKSLCRPLGLIFFHLYFEIPAPPGAAGIPTYYLDILEKAHINLDDG